MQHKSKALLALALALIMVLALGTSALADDYSNHWSSSFVKDAIAKGWIAADANGNVQPDALATRGSYALMMWKSLGSPAPQKPNQFTDVSESAPYFNAVRALFEAGITTGMTETTFGPDVNLSREMAATMLVRAHKLSPANPNAYQQFADYAQISEYARAPISVMNEKGYMQGIGNNIFAPKQNLKNGEMIKIVMGVYNGVQAAQQSAAAAIAAVVQVQASSNLSLTLSLRVVSSQEIYIVADASDKDSTVNYVGWRTHTETSYTSTTGFTKESSGGSSTEIKVTENGTFAVCITNNKGGFTYKTITVKGFVKDADAPLPKLTQNTITGNKVEVTVSTSSISKSINEVYYLTSAVDAKTEYSSLPSSSGRKTISMSGNTGTFEVASNGLYAIFIDYKDGKFSYVKCNVTDIGSTYTVTFNSNGGSSVNSQNVASGGKVTEPNEPTRSGYTFVAWYKESALTNKWVFNTDTVTKNTTLYADWAPGGPVTVPVTGVTLSPTTLTLTAGGATGTITATVAPNNATTQTVTWTSSAPAVATVNNGVVTPLTQGSTTITATTTDGSKTATCTVTVTAAAPVNVPVTGVTLDKNTLALTMGGTETGTITATVVPNNATTKTVTWTSSDTNVATVSNSGVVTAKAAGSTTITVTTTDGGKTASCTVTVAAAGPISVTGVTISGANTVAVGNTIQLTADVLPANATDKSVTWSSSDTGIAMVDQTTGVVTGVADGPVTITATANDGSGKSFDYSVTVTP